MLKLKTVPWTYVISCHDGEEIVGRFYENEMWKTNHIQTITKSNYMLNGKAIIILLIIGLIKKDSQSEWIFSETETFGEICELDFSNYATKI